MRTISSFKHLFRWNKFFCKVVGHNSKSESDNYLSFENFAEADCRIEFFLKPSMEWWARCVFPTLLHHEHHPEKIHKNISTQFPPKNITILSNVYCAEMDVNKRSWQISPAWQCWEYIEPFLKPDWKDKLIEALTKKCSEIKTMKCN